MGDNWEMPNAVFRTSEGEDVPTSSSTPTLEAPTGTEHDTLEPTAEPNLDAVAVLAPTEPEREALASLYAPPEGFEAKDEAAETPPAPSPGVAVVAQPYVSEQFSTDEIAPKPSTPAKAKAKSSAGTIIKVILGIILIGLIGVAGVLIYWFKFRPPVE